MANHTTGAQRYNKKLFAIFEQAERLKKEQLITNMTKKSIIKKYALHDFKTVESAQKYIRTQYPKDKNDSLDCIAVAGYLFTMDEYDHDGQVITWGNKKYSKALEMHTANRYKFGYGDATLTLDEMYSYRNDLNYIE